MNLSNLYRWCDENGGGLVIASSIEEAKEKLVKKNDGSFAEDYKVWPWENDDYYDEDNIDVFDIYGL